MYGYCRVRKEIFLYTKINQKKGGIEVNIIKSFNNTLDYLETVLDDEIDEKKVTQLSGYSYSMFSRLYSDRNNAFRISKKQKIDGSSHYIKRYGRKDY